MQTKYLKLKEQQNSLSISIAVRWDFERERLMTFMLKRQDMNQTGPNFIKVTLQILRGSFCALVVSDNISVYYFRSRTQSN